MSEHISKVIITGASGPLGIMLTQQCIRNNIKVLAIVRPGSKNRKNILEHELIQIVECDIARIESVARNIREQFDVCFHLAWTHTGDEGRLDPFLQEENILSTLNAAKCALQLGCKVFIGAGSQAEYGKLDKKTNELTEERPDTMYGVTKLAAGRLVMEYCRQNGMRCNWVRIFAVYGPYENDYIFTSYVIRSLMAREVPELTPCGQIWDYLYTEDAVHALLLVAEKAKESGIYCLGSGAPKSIREYVSLIRDAIDPNLPLGIGKRPYGKAQIMHLEADISKITADTGFVPRYSFEEGIKKTIDWYRKQKESRWDIRKQGC